MRLAALLAALVLAPAPQQVPAPEAGDPTAEILARDLEQLPRAEPGRWADWAPDDPVPEALAPLLRAGMVAYFRGEYGAALAAYYRLLEQEPDYPPALYQAGTTHFRLRRYGDSILFYGRFLEVVPGEVGATQALGHDYYSLGRYEEAREHYRRVLEANPESAEAVRGLALTAYRLGEPEHALELLDQVLRLRPDHADALGWKARILYDLDRPSEALEAATQARELDPFEPRVWFLLSGIYGDLGRDEEAEQARVRFAELDRVTQSIRSLEGLLLHTPRDLAVRARLVELNRAAGNLAAVKQHLEGMARLAPTELAVRLLALDTLDGMGDAMGAAEAAGDLAKYCESEPLAWQRLQRYYAGLGNRQMEMQAGERFLRLRDAAEAASREHADPGGGGDSADSGG